MNSLVIVEANKVKNTFKSPKYSPNDEFVDGIYTGILFSKMAFYGILGWQIWHSIGQKRWQHCERVSRVRERN